MKAPQRLQRVTALTPGWKAQVATILAATGPRSGARCASTPETWVPPP